MLHETGLLSTGATVTAAVVGSRTGILKEYLAKAGSFCPAKHEKIYTLVNFRDTSLIMMHQSCKRVL